MKKPHRKKKKRAEPYTMGELNKLIDVLCHPLSKTDKGFLLVDGLLHAIVEQNPPVTIRKFIKYNLPKLMKQLEKEAEKQPRQVIESFPACAVVAEES